MFARCIASGHFLCPIDKRCLTPFHGCNGYESPPCVDLAAGSGHRPFFVHVAKKHNTMSQVQTIPFQFRENQLNVIQLNQEPWFIAKEVCDVLNHSNSRMAIASLDDDEKGVHKVYTLGGNQEVTIINESGLYSLILRSKKPEAKQFKKWVTSEVLPSIRKNGAYLTASKAEEILANPDLIIGLANQVKESRVKINQLTQEIDDRNYVIEVQQEQLKIQAPAVEYYHKVLAASDTVNTNIIAKELGMSAVTLNKLLFKEYGIIYKQGNTWLPRAKYQHMGFHRLKTHTYQGSDGEMHVTTQLVWTQKGRHFIHELIRGMKKD